VSKTFSSEDGAHYRGHHQNIGPIIKHVEFLNQKVNGAPKAGNPNEWEHVASIPMSMLIDWLTKNNYAIDQWARNDGGNPYISVDNYHRDPGVKSQFLRHFLSRDFSKLHHRHVTSKAESSQIMVPTSYRARENA
jgi:hypothetical protein